MSYALGTLAVPCLPGYVPSAAGPCVRPGSPPVDTSGTPFPSGTPSGQYYDRGTALDDKSPNQQYDQTSDGSSSPDVEYIDDTPDSGGSGGGGSSPGGAWYDTGSGASSSGMLAVGIAGVLVIAYWFWTQAG